MEIIDDVIERVEKVQGPVKKVKVRSYIAQYPVHRTAQSALHFTPWQTCSFQGHFNFSGKHSAMLQLLREDISTTVCIAMYSFIQLSELWQRGVVKLAKGSKRPQWNLKPGSLD